MEIHCNPGSIKANMGVISEYPGILREWEGERNDWMKKQYIEINQLRHNLSIK